MEGRGEVFEYTTFGGTERVAVWSQPATGSLDTPSHLESAVDGPRTPPTAEYGGHHVVDRAAGGGSGMEDSLRVASDRRLKVSGAMRVHALFAVRVTGTRTMQARTLLGSSYTSYALEVQTSFSTSTLERRYRQFHDLYLRLVMAYPGVTLPRFPDKVWFGALAPEIVQQRAQLLGEFLAVLAVHPIIGTGPELRAFLGLVEAWHHAVAACRRALNPITARVLLQAGHSLALRNSDPAMYMLRRRIDGWEGSNVGISITGKSVSATPVGRRSKWRQSVAAQRSEGGGLHQVAAPGQGDVRRPAHPALGTTAPAAGLLATRAATESNIGEHKDAELERTPIRVRSEAPLDRSRRALTGGAEARAHDREVAALASTFAEQFAEITGDRLDAAANIAVAKSLHAGLVLASKTDSESSSGSDDDAAEAPAPGELQRAWGDASATAPAAQATVSPVEEDSDDAEKVEQPTAVIDGCTGASPGSFHAFPPRPDGESPHAADGSTGTSTARPRVESAYGSYDDVFDQFLGAASPDEMNELRRHSIRLRKGEFDAAASAGSYSSGGSYAGSYASKSAYTASYDQEGSMMSRSFEVAAGIHPGMASYKTATASGELPRP